MERSGRIMYFPTRSASFLVLARTRLWTEKPVCRQERIQSSFGHQKMEVGGKIDPARIRFER